MSKAVSQLIVVLILIAVSFVSITTYWYLSSKMVFSYAPTAQVLTRVGEIELELTKIQGTTYFFIARIKLLNLGTEPYVITSGSVYFIVTGTTGNTIMKECGITTLNKAISPGSVSEVLSSCTFSGSEIQALFGSSDVKADLIKSSAKFAYIKITLSGGGGGGSGGGRGSLIII